MEHWNERRRMEERERERGGFGFGLRRERDDERYRNEDETQRFGERNAGRDRGRDAERYSMQNRDEDRASQQWQGGTSEGYGSRGDEDRQRSRESSNPRGEEHRFSPDWSQDDVRPRYSDDTYYARNRESGERRQDYGGRRAGGEEGSMRSRERGVDDSYYAGYYSRSMTPFSYGGGRGQIYAESLTLSGPHSGRGPKGYKRSSDQIVEEASRRLEQDGHIDASDIEVTCEDGIIRLRGSVPDRKTKRLAEECVESVYGIRDVMNELKLSSRQDASASGSDSSRGSQTSTLVAGHGEAGQAGPMGQAGQGAQSGQGSQANKARSDDSQGRMPH